MNPMDGHTTGVARGGATRSAALVSGAVATVLVVIAMLRLPIAAVFVFGILAIAIIAGVLAVVFGILSLRRRIGRTSSVVGVILGVGAIIGAGIFFALTVPGLFPSAVTQIELRASGDSAFSIDYSDDVQERSETSAAGEWKAMFGTRNTSTEMTVSAEEPGDVSCEIIRDGEVVAKELSDSGTVSCRYTGSR